MRLMDRDGHRLMQLAYLILAIVAAYLIGSVPFAVLTSRVDGSG